MTLQNKSTQPIPRSISPIRRQSVPNVHFDRPFHLVSSGAARDLYSIYALDRPLAPGETAHPHVQQSGTRPAASAMATNSPSLPTTAPFSTPSYLPICRLQPGLRAGRPAPPPRGEASRARRNGPPRREPVHSLNNLFTASPTGSPITPWSARHREQIAIAPGYLQREWQADGRHFFEYSMGSTHISDFFAYHLRALQNRKETYHGPHGDVALRSTTIQPTPTTSTTCWPAPATGSDYYQARLQPLPVHPVPHPGVSPLPHLRAVLSQHRSVLRRHRLHRTRGSRPTSTSPIS
jgi:ABC-2 type transport system permease protein